MRELAFQPRRIEVYRYGCDLPANTITYDYILTPLFIVSDTCFIAISDGDEIVSYKDGGFELIRKINNVNRRVAIRRPTSLSTSAQAG